MQGSFQNSLTFQNVKIEEIKHSKRLWVSDVKPLFFAFFDITFIITLSIRSYIEHSSVPLNNTNLKFLWNIPLCIVISTVFVVFDKWENILLRFLFYIKHLEGR